MGDMPGSSRSSPRALCQADAGGPAQAGRGRHLLAAPREQIGLRCRHRRRSARCRRAFLIPFLSTEQERGVQTGTPAAHRRDHVVRCLPSVRRRGGGTCKGLYRKPGWRRLSPHARTTTAQRSTAAMAPSVYAVVGPYAAEVVVRTQLTDSGYIGLHAKVRLGQTARRPRRRADLRPRPDELPRAQAHLHWHMAPAHPFTTVRQRPT